MATTARTTITQRKPLKSTAESLSDIEEKAKQRLQEEKFDYITAAADERTSFNDNSQAFKRLKLRPRLLRGISQVQLSTTVLGHQVSMPICISPSATHKLVHPDGEVATSKACARAKSAMGISFFTSCPVEDVVNASPDTVCFQHLHLLKDKELLKRTIFRAERAGVKGFMLSIDCPVQGRLSFKDGTANMYKFVKSTGVKYDVFGEYNRGNRAALTDLEADWSVISWLKSLTKLPVIIKGILTAEDAKLAVQHGADAIIVSNHGGRQLDGVPATIDALPEVVKVVNGQVEVYMDGGVRLGTDVLKALALGARAVFIGRPVLYGLAYQGEEGVYKVLEILREELTRAMFLSGCSSVNDIPSSIVSRRCQCHL